MILHCMKASLWEKRKALSHWGEEELVRDGFIHCSPLKYWWRVAPNFKNAKEDLLLLLLEEDKLEVKPKYEDGGEGRLYPHVYGMVNNSAVVQVLPFLRDEEGNYVRNAELGYVVEE